MKNLILLVILISLLISPYIYKKYIIIRNKSVLKIRQYIYKYHKDVYIYLPSTNIMIYNLTHSITNEYWINYCYQLKRKQE